MKYTIPVKVILSSVALGWSAYAFFDGNIELALYMTMVAVYFKTPEIGRN